MKSRRIYYTLILVCAVLPVILSFLFVYVFKVEVIFWDEWTLVPLLNKFTSGTLKFADLFQQHNEHRMFFPRLLILLCVFFTQNYSSVLLMYLTQICFLISLLALYLQMKQQFHLTLKTLPAWCIPIPFLLFSWRQWENMLWGFQITFVLPFLFSTLSLYALYKLPVSPTNRTRRQTALYFTGAVISATIASYSMSMGLFVWIAGGIQLILVHQNQFKKTCLFLWGIIGVIEWVIYFFHFPSKSLFDLSEGLNGVLIYAKHFITLIGAFFYSESYAFIYGIVSLLLFAIILCVLGIRRLIRQNRFWVSLGIYALIVLLAITLGRSSFGGQFVMWSRYNTYTIAFMLSLYVLSASMAFRSRNSSFMLPIRGLFGLVSCFMIFGLYQSFYHGFYDGKKTKEYFEKAALTLLNYDIASAQELNRLYPSSAFVQEHAVFLKKQGYSVFNAHHIKSKYLLQGVIAFNLPSHEKFLYTGWSYAETWGRWAITQEAFVSFALPEKRVYEVTIEAQAPPLKAKEQVIEIYLNDTFLKKIILPQGRWVLVKVSLPEALLNNNLERLKLAAQYALSPAEQNIGPDTRPLSLGVKSIKIN